MDKTSWTLVCDILGDKIITGNYNDLSSYFNIILQPVKYLNN